MSLGCFFGRIVPSDAATESCFSIRGNRENEFASFQASDTKTLQSQVNKAAKKRLSLSGLEVLHGRLPRVVKLQSPLPRSKSGEFDMSPAARFCFSAERLALIQNV